MDHPLLLDENKALRKRVVQLLSNGFKAERQSDIIFVCGGNKEDDQRQLFEKYFRQELKEFIYFKPEYAIKYVIGDRSGETFDLADFEGIVSELSQAVVIFPEAAGSFAETGYFAAIEKMAKNVILALDQNWQHKDSFISLGPAKKININSIYQPNLQIDYNNPDYTSIAERIKRNRRLNKKLIEIKNFRSLTNYEILFLIHNIIRLLRLATITDINYIIAALFNSRYSRKKVDQIASILIGAAIVEQKSEYGHLVINKNIPNLMEVIEGRQGEMTKVEIEIGGILDDTAHPIYPVAREIL